MILILNRCMKPRLISYTTNKMPKGTRLDPGSYLPKSYIDKHLAQFDDPGTKDATMYAIRFTSDDAAEKIAKSVRSSELGNLEWTYPYTGTGFISSASKLDIGTKKPYSILEQGKTVIPEYVAKSIDNIGVRIEKCAEMYKITDSGEEILYAVFDYASKCFKKLGD